MTDWKQAVGTRTARLKYGMGGTHGEGKVVAYSEHPQICILTASGERVWWRSDLAELVEENHQDPLVAMAELAQEQRGCPAACGCTDCDLLGEIKRERQCVGREPSGCCMRMDCPVHGTTATT